MEREPLLHVFVMERGQNSEGAGICGMGSGLQRGGMITQDHDPVGIKFAHTVQDGAHDFFVKILDRTDLSFQISFVTHFIGCFHMDENKIHVFQSGQRSLRFPDIIGVGITGGAGDPNDLKTGIDTDSIEEVHCRNHPALQLILIGEPDHPGRPALPPQPYGRGRSFSGR